MSLIINAADATRTDGPHRPFTARLALNDAIKGALKKSGDHLAIEQLIVDGTPVESKTLQIALCQIKPAGWNLTSKRDGQYGLNIWRLK